LNHAGVLTGIAIGVGLGAGLCAFAMQWAGRWRTSSAGRWKRGSAIDVRAVFDEMTDGAVIFDCDGNVLVSNKAATDALGMEQGAYSMSSLASDFEHLSGDGELLSVDQWPSSRALRGDFVQSFEIINRPMGGGLAKTALVTTTPIRDSSGKIIQILLLRRDITQRKQFDAMARLLGAIVDSSEDAIIAKDAQGMVLSWNRAAEKIFGYTAEEMIGQSIKRLLPEDRRSEEEEILAQIKNGEIVDHLETTRLRKDGKQILISVTISPIRDAEGKFVGASKVARDITAQRQLERQAQQSNKMQAIGQLTGGIAHDFNNLLGVMIGNHDLLEPLIVGMEAASKRLRTAQRAALRGADLTKRLLAFSCNEELNPLLTSLGEAIHNTLELAGRGLGPEIKIVAQIDETVPRVLVDRAGLETLLLNLFVNARDAMPEGGALTVSTQTTSIERDYPPAQMGDLKPGSYACVSVSDTGHGMSRATLERACEPFFTTKPRGRGTGLGLAMAYGFVKQSGGTVRIYSEIGFGTSVSFYLPIPVDQVALDKPAAASTALSLEGCTVLLVDDEEDLLEIAATYLGEIGCTALQATDGGSALEILMHGGPIDVLITDIVMPGGMSGAALAEQARQLRPQMKIIYCSGFPADALAERTSLRMDGPLLRKPYSRADVHAIVRRAMAEPEQQLARQA